MKTLNVITYLIFAALSVLIYFGAEKYQEDQLGSDQAVAGLQELFDKFGTDFSDYKSTFVAVDERLTGIEQNSTTQNWPELEFKLVQKFVNRDGLIVYDIHYRYGDSDWKIIQPESETADEEQIFGTTEIQPVYPDGLVEEKAEPESILNSNQ